MTKIYDCFTFYNELDLLELRLAELYNKVDHFVIVESNQTFTNRPKPWNFAENIDRYSNYLDKIIYVQVDDMPGSANAWDNERFQRDQIIRGIQSAEPEDLIIITDIDEIVRPAAIEHMKTSDATLFPLRMTLSNFKINYMKLNPDRYGIWGMATIRSNLNHILPDAFRNMRFQFTNAPHQYTSGDIEVIEHGGWHFGYMGDKNYLIDKARSFSHTEVNTPEFLDQIDPEASIAQGTSWDRKSQDQYTVVDLDHYFPQTILNNQEKYVGVILPNSGRSAFDLLPKFPYNT